MSERELDRKLDEHLAALREATARTKLRPGLATRALAAAKQQQAEGDFWSKLLRAARFELPALGLMAAAAVFLAVRARPATTQETDTAPTQATNTVSFFPEQDDTEAWASWAWDESWDTSLWNEQDG